MMMVSVFIERGCCIPPCTLMVIWLLVCLHFTLCDTACVQTIDKAMLLLHVQHAVKDSLLSLFTVVSIGFEQQSYSCRESEPESCVLCIAILSTSPVSDDLHISLLAVTLPNTATRMSHMIQAPLS